MAYKLKTTGIATKLLACVVVDDDEVIKDLVPGNTVSAHPSVTVGVGSWAGASRKYFRTSGTGDPTTAQGYVVSWSGTKPITNSGPGLGLFFACDGAYNPVGAVSNGAAFIQIGTSTKYGGLGTFSGVGRIGGTPSVADYGSTTLPTNGTTKFSLGGNYKASGTAQIFYGEHGQTLVEDGPATSVGQFNMGSPAGAIGGWYSGVGEFVPFKPYVALISQPELTLAEYQSLHNDWFGTLIQVVATTVRKIRVTNIHPDAIGATVSGTVFQAPTGSRVHGAEVGVFSGRTVVSDGAGGASFTILASDVGGSGLALGTGPVVILQSSTGASVGVYAATVIDEAV